MIVLEPLRNKDEYYLLTAYHIEGKDKARNYLGQFWDNFYTKTPLKHLQRGFLVTPTGLKPVTF